MSTKPRTFEADVKERHRDKARKPLADLAAIPIEHFEPTRGLGRGFVGQQNITGLYWSATTAGHVFYESLLEKAALIRLDRDPNVAWIAAQPLCLHYRDGNRPSEHTPDVLVELGDGSRRLVDVKQADKAQREDFLRQARATTEACQQLGWDYEVMSEPPYLLMTNLRFLSGYRRVVPDPYGDADTFLRAVDASPMAVTDLLALAQGPEILAKPVLMGLLWRSELSVDLNERLHEDTLVSRPAQLLEGH